MGDIRHHYLSFESKQTEMELEREWVSQDLLCQLQNNQDKEIENGTPFETTLHGLWPQLIKSTDIWNKMLTSSTLMMLLILWKTWVIDFIPHIL